MGAVGQTACDPGRLWSAKGRSLDPAARPRQLYFSQEKRHNLATQGNGRSLEKTDPNSAGKPTRPILVAGIAVLSFVVALGVLYAVGSKSRRSREGEAGFLHPEIKPFDARKTKQIFQLLLNGGLQTVVAVNAADQEQIGLIQARLKEQAEKFQNGDFSDSAMIHGGETPELAEMRLGVKQITIRYDPMSDGGQI